MGPQSWFLYALRCADGTLYAGVTTDLARRMAEHNAGRGARYTAGRRPVRLLAAWRFPDRAAAQRAEARFRRLPRARKLALAAQRPPLEGAPFYADEGASDGSSTPARFCPRCAGLLKTVVRTAKVFSARGRILDAPSVSNESMWVGSAVNSR